jgi:hypothetical protein
VLAGGNYLVAQPPFEVIGLEHLAYATFGPEAAHLVKSAAGACGAVTEEGSCEGDTVVRCSAVDEGTPHVTSSACEDTCVQTPEGAACAPSCTADADCDGIAALGTCSAEGVCTWSEATQCAGIGGPIACSWCCYQAGGTGCEAMCGTSPEPYPHPLQGYP